MSRSVPLRLVGALALVLGPLTACHDVNEPRVPASIQIAGGDAQSATVATLLPVAPTVRVVTSDGKPVPNTPVTFAVAAGGGTMATVRDTTDRTGTARAAGWILGTTVGENLLTASSGLLPSVTIRATAVADLPAAILLTREPAAASVSGEPLPTQPAVQLLDRFGNSAGQAGVTVAVAVLEGAAKVINGTAITAADGSAVFSALALDAPAGSYTLEFRSPGLTPRRAAGLVLIGAGICGDAGAGAVTLDFQLGQLWRIRADAPDAPTCLAFELSRAAGQQYLLLFENMPLNGSYGEGMFDALPRSPADFSFAVSGTPSTAGPAAPTPAFRQLVFPPAEQEVPYGWDFGDGIIREGRVGPLPTGQAEPRLVRRGVAVSLLSAEADPQVGDTVSVYLEGISRLSIPAGQQQAVIRYLSDQLIFAEDVRLDSALLRDGSTPEAPVHNSPMTQADLEAIAQEYAAYARVQGNLLFENRFNNSVESRSPSNRVLAVHTLMYANNIWGYTYSSSYYFAFDYWVGSTDGTTRLLAQHPQRIADDLFMHEIAHLRHYGMLERAGRTAQRGNQWLVEGFARFSERLPIANRLLGPVQPARTNNVLLPRNPAFGNAYYYDDVPTYLQAGASMFGGYGASSYVFDYLADLVALRGGDPLSALRDFVVNAGSQANLDAAVARWLPDAASFGELFTRARLALYTDDYSGGQLPAWTQYQQFQLRASRPPGSQSASDPRNAWLKVVPDQPFSSLVSSLTAGSARGLLLDGTAATGSARISIAAPRTANGVISIARIH